MAKARGGDFSDILVRDQLVSSDQLAEARSMAESSGAKLQDILIKLGYVTQEQAVKAFAEFNKMEFVDLNGRVIPEEVINSVPESVARDNIIIPLEVDGPMLKIAMSDPTNFDLVNKLQFILNKEIVPSVASKDQITELINKHYGSDDDNAVAQLLKEGFADYEDGGGGAKGPGLSDSNEGDAPIIRLVNLIIQEGVNDRASDIHIEPFAERIR
ncbi:MAG: type II/IV secretion system protein, partial [Planctomycetota bacterium]